MIYQFLISKIVIKIRKHKKKKTYHYQSDVVIKRINIVFLVHNYIFDTVLDAIIVISAACTNFKVDRDQSEKQFPSIARTIINKSLILLALYGFINSYNHVPVDTMRCR